MDNFEKKSEFSDIMNTLNMFVNENLLNELIKNTVNLSIFESVIKLKKYFIITENQKKVEFEFEKLFSLSVENMETFENAFFIQENENEFMKMFSYLNNKTSKFPEKNEFLLKVFETSLNFVNKITDKNVQNILYLISFEIFKHLIKENNVNPNDLMSISLNIAKTTGRTEDVLKEMWQYITKNNNIELFCRITEFSEIDNNCFLTFISNDYLFIFLEKNLNSGDEFEKKIAEKFLQKLLKIIFQTDEFYSSFVSFNKDTKEEVFKMWNIYFNFIEISKEKQLHLVIPAFPLLSEISKMHSIWLTYIFNNFLSHPNNVISYQTLIHLFQNVLYYHYNFFEKIVKKVLIALNKTEYSDLVLCTFKELKKCSSKYLECISNNFSEINWAPIPFYLFCKSILNFERPINLVHFFKFISISLQLPNKSIKLKCMLLLGYYFENNFDYYTEDLSLTVMSKILEQTELFWNSTNFYNKVLDHFGKNYNLIFTNDYYRKAFLKVFKNSSHPYETKIKELFMKYYLENELPISVAAPILQTFPDIIRDDIFNHYLSISFEESECLEKQENIKIMSDIMIKNTNIMIERQLVTKSFNILLMETDFKKSCVSLAFEVINKIKTKNLKIIDRWRDILMGGCKLSSNIYVCFLEIYIKGKLERDFDHNIKEFCNICSTFCDVLPHAAYPMFFSKIKILFDININDEIFELVDIFAIRIMEIKNNKDFEKTLEIFLESLLLLSEKSYSSKVLEVLKNLMQKSQNMLEIRIILSKVLLNFSRKNPKNLIDFVDIVSELLLFGDVLKKDQIAEFSVVFTNDGEIPYHKEGHNLTYVYQRNLVRNNALNCILPPQDEMFLLPNNFYEVLFLNLYNQYKLYYKKNYFKDSQIHLTKHRILQIFLLIHSFIEDKKKLIDFAIDCLSEETNHISVRFFLQWLLINNLKETTDDYFGIILNKINSGKLQPSTVINFLPVFYHLGCYWQNPLFWDELMEKVLPYTMGEFFNLRFFSQTIFVKIFLKLEKYDQLIKKYEVMYKSTKQELDRNYKKIAAIDEFMLDYFSLESYNSVNDIFITIPKDLDLIHETEFVTLSFEDFSPNCIFPLYNKSRSVEYPPRIETKSLFDRIEEHQNLSLRIQQKINPTKEEALSKKGDLIVVASLIEKVPNIGGLCRSCEIFGVKNLVVETTTIKNNKEFLGLSRFSENWVDIKEVKVKNLKQYLTSLKSEGYFLVGAEQTSKSVNLNCYNFPKKCVLILGNEKQGIPADFLYLLDDCLEIPQMGMTRSLNVHVAASLIIWEYAKQHII